MRRLIPTHRSRALFHGADTTRAPRPGESHGISYHFVTRDDFLDLVKRDGFIEHAEFGGNMYGTSVQAVEDVKKGGKMCILDIDTQVRAVSRCPCLGVKASEPCADLLPAPFPLFDRFTASLAGSQADQV